jgi:hypothetical protein
MAQAKNKICYNAVYRDFHGGVKAAIKQNRTNFREPSINI